MPPSARERVACTVTDITLESFRRGDSDPNEDFIVGLGAVKCPVGVDPRRGAKPRQRLFCIWRIETRKTNANVVKGLRGIALGTFLAKRGP